MVEELVAALDDWVVVSPEEVDEVREEVVLVGSAALVVVVATPAAAPVAMAPRPAARVATLTILTDFQVAEYLAIWSGGRNVEEKKKETSAELADGSIQIP